jgi:deoxyribodipyrimidine photo-lyase
MTKGPRTFPDVRLRQGNELSANERGDYVLYWMIGSRRATYNYGLERALMWAERLGRPLLILEALRCGYKWASDRLHRFVLDGMRANRSHFAKAHVTYFPYVEPHHGAGKGLLEALAASACLVVTDDYPSFFLPHMVRAVSARLPVPIEIVDSNGLLPLHLTSNVFPTAFAFRRHLQRTLRAELERAPAADPLSAYRVPHDAPLPAKIARRWPIASDPLLDGDLEALRALPIDHQVGVVDTRGGSDAAQSTLGDFLDHRLDHYGEGRNHPDEEATSGLSPYLHFGHLSVHEVLGRIAEREGWSPDKLATRVTGQRENFWHLSPGAEKFLDEIVTWREVGYNFVSHREDYDQFETLPDWAKKTLARHASDPRSHVYTLAEFEQAQTHDPLWNAAERQLTREGRLHNYLRMLWGKKILEWSKTPEEALAIMIELNNKYALDGRDPNSYTGIFWVLGRYDRPWAPERPIFGTVRYMSSENTAKKLHVKQYLRRYGENA